MSNSNKVRVLMTLTTYYDIEIDLAEYGEDVNDAVDERDPDVLSDWCNKDTMTDYEYEVEHVEHVIGDL
jgi:hypothetical protein